MRRSIPFVLVAGLLAACGSTAQVSSTGVIGGDQQGTTGGDGLGTPNAPGTVDGGTTGAVGPSGTTARTGTSGGVAGPAAPGTTGGSTSGTGTQVGANGPGVSATEIKIGLLHDVNAGAVNEAAGVGAITSGDSQANERAIIKDINAHGGVGGRKLVPVYVEFDSASTQTVDQQYAAACEEMTRDKKVFAFIGTALRESFIECLNRAGVTFISQSLPQFGERAFRAHLGFLEMGSANVDRLAAAFVQPLVDQRYFTPWNTGTGRPAAAGQVKIGILTLDDTVFGPAVDHTLVPAIKRLGFPVQVAKISPLSTASDAGAQAAAVKSAQLDFFTNKVTHVIPFESNGNLGTFFLPHSRSQRYFPRYGIYTGSAMEALLEAGVADPAQMNGAVGFGWMPAVDLRRRDNAATAPWSNDERRHCLKVMRDNGITFTSGNAEGIAMNDCAGLYLLPRVAQLVPRELNAITFLRAAESMGRSYQPAGTVGIGFGPGRHDAADRIYYWRFENPCKCFRYTGGARPLP